MLRLRWLGVFCGLVFAGSVQADTAEQIIQQALLSLQPDLPIESISASAMPNLYQVELKGGRLLYASADGEFLLQGNLFQLHNGQATNLTEQVEQKAIATQMNTIPMDEMVVFTGPETKTHVTVFTDTDCGYCQKLHSEVAELNKLGVEVRYLAFPRQGVGSHGYTTLTSIWCADDRLRRIPQRHKREAIALRARLHELACALLGQVDAGLAFVLGRHRVGDIHHQHPVRLSRRAETRSQ